MFLKEIDELKFGGVSGWSGAEGRDRRRVCSRDYRFSLTLPYGNWMMKFVGNEDYIVRLKGWNNRKFHSKILSSFGNLL